MPDTRITGLAAQTGAAVDTADPLVIVDVSDVSMAATGTDKKITAGELALAVQALLDLAVASDLVVLAPATSGRNVIEPTADATALTLKAFTGQTEPLAVWQDDAGNVILNLGPDGTLTPHLLGLIGQYVDHIAAYGGDPGLVDPAEGDDAGAWLAMSVGGNEPETVAMAFGYGNPTESLMEWAVTETQSTQSFTFPGSAASVQIRATDSAAFIAITGAAGQGYPLLLLSSESLAGAMRVSKLGAIGTKSTEPADVDIDNGECFRWFDPTVGAPTIMFKAKDANGDVFTALIPMTAA